MAEPKRTLKSRNRSKNKERMYVFITLAAIACVAILIVSMSFALRNSDGREDGRTDATEIGAKDHPEDKSPSQAADHNAESGADETYAHEGPQTDVPETTHEGSVTSGTDANIPSPSLTVDVETVKSSDSDCEITMIYPRVKSAPSSHSVSEMNSAIREYMDEKKRLACMGASDDEYEYIIERTEIEYVGKSFFSAVVIGHFYLNGAPHPTVFAYAVNFDAESCKIVPAEELIHDFDRIKNNFLGGRFKLKEGMDELLGETNYEDMFTGYMPEYDIYPEVYYTGDGFGLAVELVYTLGGYALFEIPRSSLGESIYVPAK